MTTTATKRAKPATPATKSQVKAKPRSRLTTTEQELARGLMAECTLPKLRNPQCLKDVFVPFSDDAKWIEQSWEQFQSFVLLAIQLNTSAVNPRDQAALSLHVRLRAEARAKAIFRTVRARLDPLLAGELDTDLMQLRAFAIRCLAKAAEAQAALALELLEELVKQGFLGRYVRSGSELRYSFVNHELLYLRGKVSDPDHMRLATAASGTRRAIRRVTHEHCIFDAHFEPHDQTTTTPPSSVRQLLSCVPGWLSPLVKVIQGHIYEVGEKEELLDYETLRDFSTVEEERHQVILDDPAVVIGGHKGVGYVLTGWYEDPPRDDRSPVAPTTFARQLLFIALIAVLFLLGIWMLSPTPFVGLLGAALACVTLSVATYRANWRYGRPPILGFRL